MTSGEAFFLFATTVLHTARVAAVAFDLDQVLILRVPAVVAAIFRIPRNRTATDLMCTFVVVCHSNFPFFKILPVPGQLLKLQAELTKTGNRPIIT